MGQDVNDCEGHFANYSEYSKTFRAWMVAYGIGGPVLLLINKDAPASLAGAQDLRTIVTLFVSGVVFQILLALINKWAAWHMYRGAYSLQTGSADETHHESNTYKFWNWVNKQSWFDFSCDMLSLLAFAWATWLALNVLLGTYQ